MITFLKFGQFGRLGNQLFEIAATIGIAENNKTQFAFAKWEYGEYFQNPLPFTDCAGCKVYKAKGTNYYEILLNNKIDWSLEGFFQSEKFFKHSKASVLHYLKPSKKVEEYIDAKYGKLLTKNTCSMHVRRGDYINQRYFFPSQPVEYYQKAMTGFSENTTFVVFSDDLEWCKQNFIGDKFVFINGEKDVVDLLLMSKCKHNILSNSSFSWWGAWLNQNPDKRMICPERWFGPGVSNSFTKDIFMEDFERIILPKETFAEKRSSLINPLIYTFFSIKGFFRICYSGLYDTAKYFIKPLIRR